MITGQAEQNKVSVFRAYQKLHAVDTEGLLSYIMDEITCTFLKKAEGIGKSGLKIALYHLLSGVVEIRHEFYAAYETANRVVLAAKISCTKTNGSKSSVWGLIFFKMERVFIKVMKVFMDITPLSV
jgi:predicted component of viral defense system (DUF524 family)